MADDLTELTALVTTRFTDIRSELRVLSLEIRASFAEIRATLAEMRLEIADVKARQVTLFDELAAFRSEYNEHTHPED